MNPRHRALLICGLLSFPLAAYAHPLSLSYAEIRIEPQGVSAQVEVQNVDVVHDLHGLSEKSLLSVATVQAHKIDLANLLTSRLILRGAAAALTPIVDSIAPDVEQKSLRFRFHYAWQTSPARLRIQCRLFSYHPSQTILDIYEGEALKRETVFDDLTAEEDYALTTRTNTALTAPQTDRKSAGTTSLNAHYEFLAGFMLLVCGACTRLVKAKGPSRRALT